MNQRHHRFLFIDPGSRKTGWALFETGKTKGGNTAHLLYSSVLRCNPKELDWLQRIDYMIVKVLGLVKEYKVSKVIIEQPQLFMSSAKGQAASNSGAVLKLTAMVFCMRGALKHSTERYGICKLVSVSQWKGQVPKEVTQRRVRKHWNWKGESEDEADAVGLGDWYFRKHLGYKPV